VWLLAKHIYIYILPIYTSFSETAHYPLTSYNNFSNFSSFRLTLSTNATVTTPSATEAGIAMNSP
jgi:hypothetical protein